MPTELKIIYYIINRGNVEMLTFFASSKETSRSKGDLARVLQSQNRNTTLRVKAETKEKALQKVAVAIKVATRINNF